MGTVPLSATFSHDALDRRLAKTLNGATTTYLYDGADIVTEAEATNASYLSMLTIDEPLVRQTPNGNEYFHTDDLGSTVALSDDSGSVTTRYTYGPFGSTTVTGTSTNPFQFTGRENDGTGLYYYRARYYSPSRSRFLSEDPIGFDAGDPNLYAYVSNSPTNLVDPSGEAGRIPPFVKKCVVGLIKAIAKIAGTDLAKRKPDVDPDDLLDAAKGCGGGGSAGKNASNASRSGRGKNKLDPDPAAQGPHTTFRRDPSTGQVNHYQTWTPSDPRNPNPWTPGKRFDRDGDPHFNKVTGQDVPTPHINDPSVPGKVRPALPGEMPK